MMLTHNSRSILGRSCRSLFVVLCLLFLIALQLDCQPRTPGCDVVSVAQTDSTSSVKGTGYHGIVIRENYHISESVDLAMWSELPDSAEFRVASESEICSFERRLADAYLEDAHLAHNLQRVVEVVRPEFLATFFRQYVGYEQSGRSILKVFLTDPAMVSAIRRDEHLPIITDDGWPGNIVLYYDVTEDMIE